LTLWGEQAKKYTATDHPVLAVKGARVGDFGGEVDGVPSDIAEIENFYS